MTIEGKPLLEVRDLVVVRGGREILVVDELVIREGETLAIVGPNGAGKSTLLLALAGLLRPERGTILFRGAPVSRTDDLAHRRRLGLVLPAPLLLSVSVFDNVAVGLRFRGVAAAETRRRVEEWLERLGIAHLRDRPASQLSSGEAQRTSLARSLVLDPPLLLLDEPFVSLDSTARAQLLDDFERLTTGITTTRVLVTHHIHEAVRLGDRLAVLLDGRIRQCDVPERVMASPVDADVARLLVPDARIRGRVVASEDGLIVMDVGARVEDPAARGAAMLRALRPGGDATVGSGDAAGTADVGDTRGTRGTGDADGR